MVSEPLARVRVTSLVGNVMVYVYVPEPVTAKTAEATVPVVAGSVTPPVGVRTPAVSNTTVPPLAPTAIFPKLISVVLVIPIGVTIVADAVALAVDCACEMVVKPTAAMAKTTSFFIWIDFLDYFFSGSKEP
jgi:hypothetical protein